MYDRIIIGAGIYGLYAAYKSAEKGYNVLVLEADSKALTRGSKVNQARLHSGYHYPRSKPTAQKSRDYFFRFMNDFSDAIYKDFKQLYAISSKDSLTSAKNFKTFCDDLNIKCDKIDSSKFFKPGTVDALYDTLEYAIDYKKLREILLDNCGKYSNLDIKYNETVKGIDYTDGIYNLTTNSSTYSTKWVLNATYASTNQIASMLDLETLDIKYELCEVILCNVSDNLKPYGITVMDGPFFSIMPFGDGTYHSLTSVCHTPHVTSYDNTPTYDCQKHREDCNCNILKNCNNCKFAPQNKIDEMVSLAKSYLNDDITIEPIKSFYSVKPILNSCEKDDARPTIIKSYAKAKDFYTVFSGKLNTIYDLDVII